MNLPIRKYNILKKSRDYPFNLENKIYNIKKKPNIKFQRNRRKNNNNIASTNAVITETEIISFIING